MAIPIWSSQTGEMVIRFYDQGIFDGLGVVPTPSAPDPTEIPTGPIPIPKGASQVRAVGYLPVVYKDGTTRQVSAYFSQPEAIFKDKIYPFVSVNRDDIAPAMHRWHSVGQLEYRSGVSGTERISSSGVSGFGQYVAKVQAMPYDITYTISMFDRYEVGAQQILSKVLRAYPPIGKLNVFDSLGLNRSYEAYQEGSIANLQDITDPVNRVRGYAITVRVEGELDLADPYTTDSVSGFVLNLHRLR